MHGNCRLVCFRSVLKCYGLWTKWVLKFLIFGSDDINHSNFENATKCLNQSWWYLLKHVCFILKLKDFCNTCVHFQWKKGRKQTLVDTIGILPALRMRGLHDKRHLLAKLRICGSESYIAQLISLSYKIIIAVRAIVARANVGLPSIMHKFITCFQIFHQQLKKIIVLIARYANKWNSSENMCTFLSPTHK